jgi:hypothetical protein
MHFGVLERLYNWVLKVSGSNLGRVTGYPEWGVSYFAQPSQATAIYIIYRLRQSPFIFSPYVKSGYFYTEFNGVYLLQLKQRR